MASAMAAIGAAFAGSGAAAAGTAATAGWLSTASSIATIAGGAAAGVSLLRTLGTKAPEPTPINYQAHNAVVDQANKDALLQREQLDLETNRMRGEATNRSILAAQGEQNVNLQRQQQVLAAEEASNAKARQKQLQLLEIESASIEQALRTQARQETAALDRKTKQKKLSLITGQTGRRSLLTSTALGYGRSFGVG